MARSDKEKQIMRAAEHLFTNRRFHEITMEDVRLSAGVGKGTIYRYFKDKDDLFLRVGMSGFEDLCDLINKSAFGANEPFETQLAGILEQIRGFFVRRRQIFRMMQTESLRIPFVRGAAKAQWKERQQRLVGIVADVLRHGAESGYIRDDIPVGTIATFLLGMLRGSVWQFQERAESELASPVPMLLELFMRGATAKKCTAKRG